MLAEEICEPIDWEALIEEFASFELEDQASRYDASLFEQSLVDPPSEFLDAFIGRKLEHRRGRAEAVKSLYFFLLQKRYDERLNLLHFTFNIFDDTTRLPQEIIDQTPFPHEDGIPKFKYFSLPNYHLAPKKK